MIETAPSLLLGSRSPRRLQLLKQIVPREQIAVLPPKSTEEAGFSGIGDWDGIQKRILEIARDKRDDVLAQLNDPDNSQQLGGMRAVITADTVIAGITGHGNLVVLGQPEENDSWRDTVRKWFIAYYFGKPHIAATAVCVATADGRQVERVVRTDVTFRADGRRWLEWYIATEEPRGKAGGYAIQGAGSIFVERIAGSLSNVVGLPLAELLEMFDELEIDLAASE